MKKAYLLIGIVSIVVCVVNILYMNADVIDITLEPQINDIRSTFSERERKFYDNEMNKGTDKRIIMRIINEKREEKRNLPIPTEPQTNQQIYPEVDYENFGVNRSNKEEVMFFDELLDRGMEKNRIVNEVIEWRRKYDVDDQIYPEVDYATFRVDRSNKAELDFANSLARQEGMTRNKLTNGVIEWRRKQEKYQQTFSYKLNIWRNNNGPYFFAGFFIILLFLFLWKGLPFIIKKTVILAKKTYLMIKDTRNNTTLENKNKKHK